jgi:hypothetical protein
MQVGERCVPKVDSGVAGADGSSTMPPQGVGADPMTALTPGDSTPTGAAGMPSGPAPGVAAQSPMQSGSASPSVAGSSGAAANSGASSPSAGSDAASGSAQPQACANEGAHRCAMTAGAREVCSGGVWSPFDSCPAGTVCTAAATGEDGVCLSASEACRGSSNEAVCDGQGTLILCGADTVVTEMTSCPSVRHCKLGMATKSCAMCVPGGEDGFKCQGAMLLKCAADGTGYAPLETCATEALCNPTAGACTMGACTQGQLRCQGDVLQKCKSDLTGFEMLKTCRSNLCDAQAGACDECVPGFSECKSDSVAARCSEDGAKLEMVTCPSNTPRCVGAGKCVECTTNDDCDFVCTNQTCTGECKPGDGKQHCNGTTPQTCDSRGKLVPGKIVAGKCDAECTPGAPFECEGTTKVECKADGTFKRTANAIPDCAECRPQQTKCDTARKMSQLCNSQGKWQDKGVTKECGADCTPSTSGCALGAASAGGQSHFIQECWGSDGACRIVDDGKGVAPLSCGQDGKPMVLNYCPPQACTGSEEGLFRRALCSASSSSASCGYDSSCVPLQF